MYLPALRNQPGVELVSVMGRDAERTKKFAHQWDFAQATTDADELLANADALVIATPNDTHLPLTMAALDRGIDILCEKPLALTAEDAARMTTKAQEAGAITLVPFTYRFMPTNRWVKQLIDEGYVGAPHHLGLRYFTGFARNNEYSWRFDNSEAGSGVIGDLGSHWLYLAHWLLSDAAGEIEQIGANVTHFYERGPRPDGRAYEPGEDSAVLTLRFASGAYAILQVSAVCWEGSHFNQTHHLDIHGTDGTLYAYNDWENTQSVSGVKADQPGPAAPLPIPDSVWGGARRDTVHNTYRDVFRSEGHMIGEFVQAVRTRQPVTPSFVDGLRVQRLIDASLKSAANGGQMTTVEPTL